MQKLSDNQIENRDKKRDLDAELQDSFRLLLSRTAAGDRGRYASEGLI